MIEMPKVLDAFQGKVFIVESESLADAYVQIRDDGNEKGLCRARSEHQAQISTSINMPGPQTLHSRRTTERGC